LAWSIEFDTAAKKDLGKLDKRVATRNVAFLKKRVLEDPRGVGGALIGPRLGELWKFRVGAYWIICKIEDSKLCVLVVRIGNRSGVYR
jgi:mRNA interferase RelE/StbE